MAEDRISLRRVAAQALLFVAFFGSIQVLGVVVTYGFDVPSIAINLAMAFVIGFPIFLGMVYVAETLRIRWHAHREERGPTRPPGPPMPSPLRPFHFSGRQWQSSTALVVLGFFALVVFFLLPLPPDVPLSGLLPAARWLGAAFFAMVVFAAYVGFRRLTFVIDEQGIRCEGFLRQSFDAPWEQVAQIEIAQLPFVGWMAYPAATPRLFALRSKTGTILAMFSPVASVGPRPAPALEETLRSFAAQRGIGVIDVPWKVAAGWKVAKRS